MKRITKIISILFLSFTVLACDNKNKEEAMEDKGTAKIYLIDDNIYNINLNENEYLDVNKLDLGDYSINKVYLDSNYQNEFDYKKTKIEKDQVLYATFFYDKKPEVANSNISNINLDNYIEKLMEDTPSYVPAWNQESFKARWNYIDGVFLKSIMDIYKKTNNQKYLNFVKKYVDFYINENGNFINPTNNQLSYNEKELDSVCESNILFDLYEYTNDSRYLNAIEFTYTKLMAMPRAIGSSNFYHKVEYKNQIWLDGMYMYVPFILKYANLKNDNTIYDMVINQYKFIRNNMFDNTKKLYYHGIDTSKEIFWANKETGTSKCFWLRSNGWYIVSMADSIGLLPEGNNKEYLKDLLKEALDNILNYQDDDTKLFYQLVDKKNECYKVKASYLSGLKNTKYMVNGDYVDRTIANYLETSGSSMLAYSLMKSSYLDNNYKKLGKEIFENIYKYYYKNNELSNICITAGLGGETKLYRDGTESYYLAEPVGVNDAKGVGPFLMAYLEYKSI